MNNNTNGTAFAAAELILETYQNYVFLLVQLSSLTLLIYAIVLALDQEIKYIWDRGFSFPNILYTFTRYGSLIVQGLNVYMFFLSLGSLCNIIGNISGSINALQYVGIQGLLITRAYSLCQGNKLIAGSLAFLFLGGFAAKVSALALSPDCTSSFGTLISDMNLFGNICTALTDVLVFGVSLRVVWGTWKMKRETRLSGIQSGTNNLVGILMNQIITRFCFVCFISLTSIIIYQFVTTPLIATFNSVQNTLSAILTADGLLVLRQQNSTAIETRNASLLSIQFGNVLGRMHASIVVEMGDPDVKGVGSEDIDTDGQRESGFAESAESVTVQGAVSA